MNRSAILQRVKNSIFPGKDHVVSLLSKMDKSADIKCRYREPQRIRCFLLPVRSRIKVVKNQLEKNEHTINLIEQSEHLVETWGGRDQELCNVFRLDYDKERFYLVYISEDENEVYGVLEFVTKEGAKKYMVRI